MYHQLLPWAFILVGCLTVSAGCGASTPVGVSEQPTDGASAEDANGDVKPGAKYSAADAIAILKTTDANQNDLEAAAASIVSLGNPGLDQLWTEYEKNSMAAVFHGNGIPQFEERCESLVVDAKESGLRFLDEKINEYRQNELNGVDNKLFESIGGTDIDRLTSLHIWKSKLQRDTNGLRYRICGMLGDSDAIAKMDQENESHRKRLLEKNK